MVAAGAGRRQRGRPEAGGAVARLGADARARRCTRAGVPPDALRLLPGYGDAGAALVRDPRVHVIAFTGSSAVGLEIVRAAAETPEGQRHVKRVVAEMGGKNCVIVDSDADLDEVVPGDRRLGVRLRRPEVLGRGAGARPRARSPTPSGAPRGRGRGAERRAGGGLHHRGPAGDRARGAGPGASASRAPRESRGGWRRAAAVAPTEGWFCPPTLAVDLREDRRVLREEIFGPLLAVSSGSRASTRRATWSTRCPSPSPAGLFSRSPEAVEHVIAAPPGRQPLRQPGDHRRDGRAPAVRRQPAVGHRLEGRRPGLPAPVRRAPGGDREHDASRARRRVADRCFARPKEYPPRARTGCPQSHGTRPSAHPDGSLNRRGPGRAEARREDRAP